MLDYLVLSLIGFACIYFLIGNLVFWNKKYKDLLSYKELKQSIDVNVSAYMLIVLDIWLEYILKWPWILLKND